MLLILAFSLSACAENSNRETLQNILSDNSTENTVTAEEEAAKTETKEYNEIEEISENHVLITYFGR